MSRTQVSLAGEVIGVLDEEAITIGDAFTIKAASGLALKPFFEGLSDMDPLSLQTLVWFLRHKKGDQTHISEVDFAIAKLELKPLADPPAEAASASKDSSSTPTSDAAETSTSESSPTSAT